MFSRRIMGLVIFFALVCFEIFIYAVTEYTLLYSFTEQASRMGALLFVVIDLLVIAVCISAKKIDIFSDTWYLFMAWVVMSGLSAYFIWFGIDRVIVARELSEYFRHQVPIYIAAITFLIRILIVGSFYISYGRDKRGNPNQRQIRFKSNGRGH